MHKMTSRAVAAYLRVLLGAASTPARPDEAATNDVAVRLYSYEEDFNTLWAMVDPTPTAHARTLVVVWDGIPLREHALPVDTSRYLTPLDWAVALSLAMTAWPEAPPVRLAIVLATDRLPPAAALGWFSRHPHWQLPELPWVRLFRTPSLTLPLAHLSDLKAFLGQPDLPVPRARSLDALRRLWSLDITAPTTPGDHHAITNLVGPLTLIGRPFGAQSAMPATAHISAMARLLWALGLTAVWRPDNDKAPAPWIDFSSPPYLDTLSMLGDASTLDLVCLDDQIHLGWSDALCVAVGAEPVVSSSSEGESVLIGTRRIPLDEARTLPLRLFGSANPDDLMTRLERLEGKEQRYRFSVTPDESESPENPARILLLDLRLFSGKPAKEKAFVTRLLKLAERFRVGADDPYHAIALERRLPWPGFLGDELEAVRHWIDNQSGETQDYLLALAFLPRLLALTDCSLPIVLFSSTGRREILDALRPYGNIFSEFEKPRFFGALTEGFLDDTRRGFAAAMAKAVELLGTRVDLAALIREPEPAPAPLTGKAFEIELFLDEQGQPNQEFSVGGILVVKAVGTLSLDQALRDWIKTQWPNRPLSKQLVRDQREAIANRLTELAQDQPVRVAIVRLSGTRESLSYQDPKAVSFIEHIAVADNLYRELLRCIFELAVYTLARSMIPTTAGSISAKVLAGTRIIPLREYRRLDPRLTEQEIKTLFRKKWGLIAENIGNRGESIRHVSYDTPRPLIEQVLHHYRGSCFHPRIDEARADTINDMTAIQGGYIRILHLLADAVLEQPSPTQNNLQSFVDEGVVCRYGSELLTLLKVQRLALRRLDAHALALARTITPWRSAHRVARLLLPDLRRIALDLSGDDLVGLAALDIGLLVEPPVKTDTFPFAPSIVPGGPKQWLSFVGTVIADQRTDQYSKGSIEIHVAEIEAPMKLPAHLCSRQPIGKWTYHFLPVRHGPHAYRYEWKRMTQ